MEPLCFCSFFLKTLRLVHDLYSGHWHSESVFSGDKGFDEPSWGTFDTQYDDAAWDSNHAKVSETFIANVRTNTCIHVCVMIIIIINMHNVTVSVHNCAPCLQH